MPRSTRVYKKRKFHGNKFKRFHDNAENIPITSEEYETNLDSMSTPSTSSSIKSVGSERSSASKRKLHYFEAEGEDSGSESRNIIIDIELLSNFIKKCTKCNCCNNSDCLTIVEDVGCRKGLSVNLQMKCAVCGDVNETRSSSMTSDKFFDINVRMVYGMRCIGKGQKAAETLCGMLNLPPPPTRFSSYSKKLEDSLTETTQNSMKAAAAQAVLENEGATDLAVSLDGTWQRRGHVSLHGVVTAVLFDTGKVVDVDILSKYCQGCRINEEHHCVKNYDGSSGGMEAIGARNIFMRSVAERGVKYSKYLGDGDTKAYMTVCESKPYGDSVEIEKLECIGHVQKRLGSRLRRLKKDLKGKKLSDGKGIGGQGRLTDSEIDLLQNYYGLAIRRNVNDAKAMHQAIWATFFHKSSTDDNPVHHLCPKGPDSWCKYQNSLVTGEEYSHKHSLPPAIIDAIKPIYRDLSQPHLLKKCLHGRTQNANESLNNCIWERIPKNVFVGAQTLRIGVLDAVLIYNDGAEARKLVLEQMGVKVGYNCGKALKDIDSERIYYANRAAEAMTKEARIQKRQKNCKRRLQDNYQNDYSPGMY